MTKIQLTMQMFLKRRNTWFTMQDLSNGVYIGFAKYKFNNIFDNCKYLERLSLPTGRKLRFLREWVYNTETGKRSHCKIKLQEDLTPKEIEYLSDFRNIIAIRMNKSNSEFDK